jgi:hypothetical protein
LLTCAVPPATFVKTVPTEIVDVAPVGPVGPTTLDGAPVGPVAPVGPKSPYLKNSSATDSDAENSAVPEIKLPVI